MKQQPVPIKPKDSLNSQRQKKHHRSHKHSESTGSLLQSPSITANSFVLDPLVLPPPALDTPDPAYPTPSASTSTQSTPQIIPSGPELGDIKLPPPPHRKRTIIHVTPNLDPSLPSSSSATTNSITSTPNSTTSSQSKKRRRNSSLVSVESISFNSPSSSPNSTLSTPKFPPSTAKTRRSASMSTAILSTQNGSNPTMTPPTPPLLSDSDLKRHARRTAHSEIERRRRSKMNHEFDSLKQLVPACQQSISNSNGSVTSSNSASNGGLHKLVILQETVEYIRYLKKCLETMETRHKEMQVHVVRLQQQVTTLISNQDSITPTNSNSSISNSGTCAPTPVPTTPITDSAIESPAIDPNLTADSKHVQPEHLYSNINPTLQHQFKQEPLQQKLQLQVDIHDETTAAAAAALVDLDKMSRKNSFSNKPLLSQLPITSPSFGPSISLSSFPSSSLVSKNMSDSLKTVSPSQKSESPTSSKENDVEPSPRIRVSDLIC